MSTIWKTIPLFISSTFRDRHAERDDWVTVVFPELLEQAEELGSFPNSAHPASVNKARAAVEPEFPRPTALPPDVPAILVRPGHDLARAVVPIGRPPRGASPGRWSILAVSQGPTVVGRPLFGLWLNRNVLRGDCL